MRPLIVFSVHAFYIRHTSYIKQFGVQKYGYNIAIPNSTELEQFYYHNTNLYTDPQIKDFSSFFNSKYSSQIDNCSVHSKNCKLTTQIYFNPYIVYAVCTNPLSSTQKCIINNLTKCHVCFIAHCTCQYLKERLKPFT